MHACKVERPIGIILSSEDQFGLWRNLKTFFRGGQEDHTSPRIENVFFQ